MASTASSARRVDGVEGAVMNLEAEQDLARGVGRLPGSRASEPSRHTSKRLPSPRNAPSQDVRVHGNIPPKTERCLDGGAADARVVIYSARWAAL